MRTHADCNPCYGSGYVSSGNYGQMIQCSQCHGTGTITRSTFDRGIFITVILVAMVGASWLLN